MTILRIDMKQLNDRRKYVMCVYDIVTESVYE
jgi:hypothetical protein